MTITRAIVLQRTQQCRQRTQQQQEQQKVFGMKKDGTACRRCIKMGNFCFQHLDQAPRPLSSQLPSSPSSPPLKASEQRQTLPVVDNDTVTDGDGDVTMEILDDNDDHSSSSTTASNRTTYGVTRNNTPCKICLKRKGFCKKHIHQQRLRQQQQQQQRAAIPAAIVSECVTEASTVTTATSPSSPTMANIQPSFGRISSTAAGAGATMTATTKTVTSNGPNRTMIDPMVMTATRHSPIFNFQAPVVAAPVRVNKKRNRQTRRSMSPQHSTRAKIMKPLTPWEELQVMDHLQSLLDALTCPPHHPQGASTIREEAEEEEIVFVKNDHYNRQFHTSSSPSSPPDTHATKTSAPAPAPAQPVDLDLHALPKLPAGFKWTTMANELRRREVRQMIRDDGNTMYELANGEDEDVWKYWKMWNFPKNPYPTIFNGNGSGNDNDGRIGENVQQQQRQEQQQHDHEGDDGADVGSESDGEDVDANDDHQSSARSVSSIWTSTTYDELSLSTISSDDEHEDDDHSNGGEEEDDDNNSCISAYSYDPRIEETLTRLRQLLQSAMTVYMAGVTIYAGAMALQSVALAVACQPVVCMIVALSMMVNARDHDNRFIQWFFMLSVVVEFMKLFGIVKEEETPSAGDSTPTGRDDEDEDDIEEVPTIIV